MHHAQPSLKPAHMACLSDEPTCVSNSYVFDLPAAPERGDYIIEPVGAGRYSVTRHDMRDTQSFADEESALHYAHQGARLFGYRVYRRTETGYSPVKPLTH